MANTSPVTRAIWLGVSVKPFTPPEKETVRRGKTVGAGPRLSKQEIAEFKRIWNMPYSQLKHEKTPTNKVGQGDEIQALF